MNFGRLLETEFVTALKLQEKTKVTQQRGLMMRF
ncbi:hypothetical protein DFP77_13741 [Marinomonas foliarum]|uniref:Uncharacterized protein n=1 Tax=Marinomonas foliarum TaxID=491950 RepID=A0A368ZQM4_9GAMM|nr:hypothetical protein DFP77_13741 [Marinomonas foliarum]